MIPELIDAWRARSLAAPPYLLPSDKALLPSKRSTHPYRSFDEFIGSPAFGAPDTRLHLGLLPIPYVGDLLHAGIYILLLNPSFAPCDYYAEEHSPEYHAALIRNLRQEHGDAAYPFFSLDPRFSWHPGFTYWHGSINSLRCVSFRSLFTRCWCREPARGKPCSS